MIFPEKGKKKQEIEGNTVTGARYGHFFSLIIHARGPMKRKFLQKTDYADLLPFCQNSVMFSGTLFSVQHFVLKSDELKIFRWSIGSYCLNE